MNKIAYLLFSLYSVGISIGYGQVDPVKKGINVLSPQCSKAILTYLASDWMEGREPGTDSDNFTEKNIPVISFETGKHSDY
jgi:hypothetical protein